MKLKLIETMDEGLIAINTAQIVYLDSGVGFFSRKPYVIINTTDSYYFKVEGTLEDVQLQLRD